MLEQPLTPFYKTSMTATHHDFYHKLSTFMDKSKTVTPKSKLKKFREQIQQMKQAEESSQLGKLLLNNHIDKSLRKSQQPSEQEITPNRLNFTQTLTSKLQRNQATFCI